MMPTRLTSEVERYVASKQRFAIHFSSTFDLRLWTLQIYNIHFSISLKQLKRCVGSLAPPLPMMDYVLSFGSTLVNPDVGSFSSLLVMLFAEAPGSWCNIDRRRINQRIYSNPLRTQLDCFSFCCSQV